MNGLRDHSPMRTFLIVVACAATATAQPVLVDRIAAVVDGVPIFQSTVEARARKGPGPVAKDALVQARGELVERALIARDAKGFVVEDSTVDGAVEEVQRRQKLDRAQLEAALAEQGLTLRAYRELVREQILELRWLMARATERGIRLTDEQTRSRELAALRVTLLGELQRRTVVEVFE